VAHLLRRTALLAITLALLFAGLQWSPLAPAARTDAGIPANPNDNFASAINASPLPFTGNQIPGDNTTEAGEPLSCLGTPYQYTQWYTFSPPATGQYEADTFGSGADTVLAIYRGSAVNALTFVDCNADFGIPQSKVFFFGVQGATYRIQGLRLRRPPVPRPYPQRPDVRLPRRNTGYEHRLQQRRRLHRGRRAPPELRERLLHW
jgi:hypothetical protein